MRVCDWCRNVHAPAHELRVELTRPAGSTSRPARLQAAPVELCDACVEAFWATVDATVAARFNNFDRPPPPAPEPPP